jgi:hypothetical protein
VKIKPYTLRAANEYVRKHHRHSKVVVGCKFCIAAVDEDDQVIGVAIVGRPVARRLDDGYVGEIVRTCTEGAKNVNSFLYGACARIWKEMGGTRIITYTLETESGISLKAAGYKHQATTQSFAPGKGWTTRKKREWQPKVHSLQKYRWERIL